MVQLSTKAKALNRVLCYQLEACDYFPRGKMYGGQAMARTIVKELGIYSDMSQEEAWAAVRTIAELAKVKHDKQTS